MTTGRALFTLALVFATCATAMDSAADPRPPPGRHVYEGTIAGKRVLVRLRCSTSCSGSYVYEAVGAPLRLSAGGVNGFDETVGTGHKARTTGHLAFVSPPGASRWQGTWSAPTPPRSAVAPSAQPIVLERVVPRAIPRVIVRRLHVQSPRDPDCHVDVRSFEISGLADRALEDRINESFAPEHLAGAVLFAAGAPRVEVEETCGRTGTQCDESALGYRLLCRAFDGRGGLYAHSDVRPTLLDARLLSARDEYDFDGGGVHPGDGVAGVTLDLGDGHVLDARDLLRDPAHEPDWSTLAIHAATDEDGEALPLALGTRDAAASFDDEWGDFYLTPTAIALVPMVSEAARIYRHQVQLVPFARAWRALRPRGPAAHLYTR